MSHVSASLYLLKVHNCTAQYGLWSDHMFQKLLNVFRPQLPLDWSGVIRIFSLTPTNELFYEAIKSMKTTCHYGLPLCFQVPHQEMVATNIHSWFHGSPGWIIPTHWRPLHRPGPSSRNVCESLPLIGQRLACSVSPWSLPRDPFNQTLIYFVINFNWWLYAIAVFYCLF